MNWRGSLALALLGALAMAPAAAAQGSGDGWRTAVYPVLGWVPLGIDIGVEVPPNDGGAGGAGDIVDGRFDGAFLGGFSTTNGRVWVEAAVIWAAVGGDVERPQLSVDADIVYGHGTFGYSVAPNWFVTGGVRRLALKYAVDFAGQATFEREPGVWDPLVGIAWHREGSGKLDLHAGFEGGGFGVGSDVDLGANFRLDWRPVRHFGISAGYNFLYFKVTNEVRDRSFVVKQTLHGPVAGIGFYF